MYDVDSGREPDPQLYKYFSHSTSSSSAQSCQVCTDLLAMAALETYILAPSFSPSTPVALFVSESSSPTPSGPPNGSASSPNSLPRRSGMHESVFKAEYHLCIPTSPCWTEAMESWALLGFCRLWGRRENGEGIGGHASLVDRRELNRSPGVSFQCIHNTILSSQQAAHDCFEHRKINFTEAGSSIYFCHCGTSFPASTRL